MKLSDLIKKDKKITPISTDTRTLKTGDIFIALRGINFDGHDFMPEAIKKGAKALIVEKQGIFSQKCNIPIVEVTNTLETLGDIARIVREQLDIPIIALTGSCGKTTTREMIYSILSNSWHAYQTLKNLNNNIGVPLTLLNIKDHHDIAIIEVGANKKNEIEYSAKILKPDVALITNVNPVHLEGFGSLGEIADIKADLLRNLQTLGFAILNANDNYFDYWVDLLKKEKPNVKILTFAKEKDANVIASNIEIVSGKTKFQLELQGKKIEIYLSFLGEHNVINAIAAVACSVALDTSLKDIKQGLENMVPLDMRLNKKKGINETTLLDDSYSANPKSMECAMEVLMKTGVGRKIMVFADMAELGDKSEYYHKEVGFIAKKMGVKKMYAIGGFASLSVESFGEGGYHFSSYYDLIDNLKKNLQPEDVILIKGSHTNRMWDIVSALSS